MIKPNDKIRSVWNICCISEHHGENGYLDIMVGSKTRSW